MGFRAVSYALAAGNTTVLKGSERSPRCYWAIGSVLQEAGLPDGCLNVLVHRPQDAADVTTTLIEHPSVKKISFTGSDAVGRIVAATAGKHLKPVLLELGGKANAIVLQDADIQLAAEQCASGALLHVSHASYTEIQDDVSVSYVPHPCHSRAVKCVCPPNESSSILPS